MKKFATLIFCRIRAAVKDSGLCNSYEVSDCLSVCHGVNQRVGRNDSCVHVRCSAGNKPLPVVSDQHYV